MIKQITEQIRNNYDKYTLFSTLLFTEEHPLIIKALKDPFIYDALDRITGPSLLLFTSMLFKGSYRYPSPPSGHPAFICPIWVEPNENRDLLLWFNIKDSRALPMLVLFTCRENDSNLYWITHPINDKSKNNVFNSIIEVLKPIVRIINERADESREKILQTAKWHVRKLHTKEKLKDLLGLIGFFRGAAGI